MRIDRGRLKNAEEGAWSLWDLRWKDEEARKAWDKPEGRVLATADAFKESWAGERRPRLLDIGCGAGRHVLALGASGFEACACDAASSSVKVASAAMASAGVEGRVAKAFMSNLPWPDGYFDFVLAWNVLYHGARHDLSRALQEARRVMSPGAWLEATFLSKRNIHYGKGLSIDAWTWIGEGGEDKAYPHCYLDRAELEESLSGFMIDSIEEYEQASYPGAWHWHVAARRPA